MSDFRLPFVVRAIGASPPDVSIRPVTDLIRREVAVFGRVPLGGNLREHRSKGIGDGQRFASTERTTAVTGFVRAIVYRRLPFVFRKPGTLPPHFFA
jgi:hypothetical protein